METFEQNAEVPLILRNKRYLVNKRLLLKKSKYFTALLSPRYSNHTDPEQCINYDFSESCFEHFIIWMHNETEYDLKNFDQFQIDHILSLLNLSTIFIVDELTDNIIQNIEEKLLLPSIVIDIWLFAQKIGLIMLENLCLATCLDRFDELPCQSICKLSKENFLKLIANVNLRCNNKSRYESIVNAWIQCYKDPSLNILLSLWTDKAKLSHGIVSSEMFHVDKEVYLHCWNDKKFFQLDAFRLPEKFFRDTIKGMQIIGRGCYLYFIGGEFNIGSGRHNKNIWRYSLITKKWFCCATMPNVRRHMIAVFAGTKLLLIGGVGQFRLKLNTMDIYDVHTGLWSQGANVPFTFTNIPRYYMFDDILIIYEQEPLHLYHSKTNVWSTYCFNNLDKFVKILPLLPLNSTAPFIDFDKSGQAFFSIIVQLTGKYKMDDKIINYIEPYIKFADKNNSSIMLHGAVVFNIRCCNKIHFLMCSWPHTKPHERIYHLHILPIEKRKFSTFPTNMFFYMIDPADLRTQKPINT